MYLETKIQHTCFILISLHHLYLMARNAEKQYGKLNRLYLQKEKEENEKKNPKRPKLDTLMTVEEIQKWLPSIKRDIDLYLKKSQVICYSDAHVEECRDEVVKLEKEYKAFVHKIRSLSPYPLTNTPWTSRPYERKMIDPLPESFTDEFKPIPTPILDKKSDSSVETPPERNIYLPLNDEPLVFSSNPGNELASLYPKNVTSYEHQNFIRTVPVTSSFISDAEKCYQKPKAVVSLVNYDSSDSES